MQLIFRLKPRRRANDESEAYFAKSHCWHCLNDVHEPTMSEWSICEVRDEHSHSPARTQVMHNTSCFIAIFGDELWILLFHLVPHHAPEAVGAVVDTRPATQTRRPGDRGGGARRENRQARPLQHSSSVGAQSYPPRCSSMSTSLHERNAGISRCVGQ